jgi:hypothetical protein
VNGARSLNCRTIAEDHRTRHFHGPAFRSVPVRAKKKGLSAMKAVSLANPRTAKIFGIVVAAGILGELCFTSGAQAATNEQRQASWRTAIAHTAVPGKGCFTASYPLIVWKQVSCVTAPQRPYIPAAGHGSAQVTGDGDDYAAVTETLTAMAVGSFPKAKHLKSEVDGGRSNVYSLQLNSNFMSGSPACATAFDTSKCLAWEQFVYSSSSRASFMQYWLIHYTGGSVHCPGGWNNFSDDCYKNSTAVGVPLQPITELPNMSISGAAVHAGIDTFVTTTATQAYTTTGQDSVVYLADGWHESEFNVVGDGGGSQANFNAGASLTVRIDLTDGSNAAPTCQPDDGTTGETNNLDLGACTAKKGKGIVLPSVQFVESLPKS